MNGAQKEQVLRITKRVLEAFGMAYLRAYKIVAIREAKAKKNANKDDESSHEDEKPQKPSTPQDPHRPRSGKYREKVTPKIKARISTWYTMDYDVDPYIAYLVEASVGERSASVYRRFNAFKALNGDLPKSCADSKKLFPTAKAFEGHHFSYDYVSGRREKLQKFLDSILAVDEMQESEDLIKFLGLTPSEDPRGDEIFDVAFELTKWRLWIWKRIPYDTKEEALSKIVIEEVKREMWPDLTRGLPNIAKLRKVAMQGLYKAITAVVGPPVSAGVKAAFEALEPIKPKIDDVINTAMDKIVEVEDSVKKQLTAKILEALTPVQEQLGEIVGGLTEKILPLGISALEDVKPSVDAVKAELHRLMTSTEESTETLEKLNKEMLTAVEERMLKTLKEVTENAVGSIKSKINIEPLMSALDPFDKLGELLRPFLTLIPDIGPHIYPLKSLMEYKVKLQKYNIADGTAGVEDLLDREESQVEWRTWWSHWDYRDATWTIYYRSWGIPELSATGWSFRQHGLKLAKLHKKVMKKWSYIFGDYLHEAAKVATPANWNEAIANAMVTGYTKALEWFQPRALKILVAFVNDFVYRFVGSKIESFALKAIDVVVSPLAAAVPSPVNQVVEVEQVATEAVRDAIHQMFEKLVGESIVLPAAKVWATSAYGK